MSRWQSIICKRFNFQNVGFDTELQKTPNSRAIPVRRMTVGGRLEKNFTTVFVGSSSSASDTRGTGRKYNFKAVFFTQTGF